jgi:hypothetical protein
MLQNPYFKALLDLESFHSKRLCKHYSLFSSTSALGEFVLRHSGGILFYRALDQFEEDMGSILTVALLSIDLPPLK